MTGKRPFFMLWIFLLGGLAVSCRPPSPPSGDLGIESPARLVEALGRGEGNREERSTVIVAVEVGPDGRALNARVDQKALLNNVPSAPEGETGFLPHQPQYQEAAIQLALDAKYVPAQRNGRAVTQTIRIPVYFYSEQRKSTRPEIKHYEHASYPLHLIDDGVEGLVEVVALVGVDGLVKETLVRDGVESLRGAAQKAAMKCTFRPATVDGEPVECWVLLPYNFALR